ncbi:MAG: hypothetical protein AAGM04_03315 [Pseudomonadota bacterium]
MSAAKSKTTAARRVAKRAIHKRAPQVPVHVLFAGANLSGTHAIFKRKDEVVRCDHVQTVAQAYAVADYQANVRPFDCIMVDMRHDADGSLLNVVPLARANLCARLVVLANAENADGFSGLPGIAEVLVAPVEPIEIIKVIVESAPDDPEDAADFSQIEPTPSRHAPPIDTDDTAPDRDLSEDVVSSSHAASDTLGQAANAESDPQHTRLAVDDDGAAQGAQGAQGAHANQGAVNATSETPTEAGTKELASATVTKGFESSLSKIQDADQQVWQRFVPLANFVYKKLAIVILTALFLTFVTYGAMIVFFMSSSSWSLPFELSRGHALVEKTERDLSSLKVRLNQIKQDITLNAVETAQAKREGRDGSLRLTLTKRTVEEELLLQENTRLEIKAHIARLKKVIQDFNAVNGKDGFAQSLDDAYAKRLITRKALNSGTLAVLETLHRVATVQNEISVKELELRKVNRRLEFLRTLLEEIPKPEITVITSAGSDLAHLARDVIEAKTQISNAERRSKASKKQGDQLRDSYAVVSRNLTSLRKTPAARALDAPVMVLFVPYTNTERFTQGQALHSCAASIVWCRRVGEVGAEIKGETTAVHPLFGKPMRGTFVEATFDHAKSVTEELMHAGRAPLFF